MFDFEDSPWEFFRLGYVTHILVLSCFSLWEVSKAIWISPFTTGNLVTVIFILVVSALIAMILDIFKYYLDCFHEKRATNRETVCKREQLIGFGGVLLCGIAPQLVVFYFKDYEQLVTISYYVSAFSIGSFKNFFLETPIYYVKSVKYGNRKILLIIFSVICFFGLIVILKSGTTSFLFFGITGYTATIELLMVLLEPFEMRTEQETAQIIEKFKKPFEIPPIPGSEMDHSFNDIFMFFYSILSVFMVILAILAGFWSSLVGIVIIGSFILWLMNTLKRKTDEKKDRMNELEFCTARLKMGFLGILTTWCGGQCLLYFVSFELKEMIEVILPLLIFALSTYYQFIHGYRDTCNLNYHKFPSFIIKTVLFLIFIGMIVIRISISSENRFQNFQMGCLQFILFFMPLGALPDLLVVMKGGVYLVGVEKQASQPASSSDRRNVSPEIKCQVCQVKFSEGSRIPRILKECGHTVCEPCADQRLKENRGSFLYCPVCRMATVVMGAASLLKKNWVVLEIMADN